VNKWLAWFTVLQRGHNLLDPTKWKKRQVTVSALVGLMYAAVRLAESYGFTIPTDDKTLDAIAVAVLAIANVLLTVGADPELGLPKRGQQSLTDKADKASHPNHTD
jgi:uncharacterized membrane protein